MRLKRIAQVLGLLYLALWSLSTAYRALHGFDHSIPQDLLFAELKIDDPAVPKGSIRLAYRELNESAQGSCWLLLHGNPMAGRSLLPLANSLDPDRRILIPDLPGFGYTEDSIASYSAEDQATVLLHWLEVEGIKQIHVVGYSQGGAVALEMAQRSPELLQSLSLLAAVGLQEQELLGSYEWNQPIYRAYYGFIWSMRWLTPHFGLLDSLVFSPNTALNFADTDLRRNRAILESLNHPTLILHSVSDRLVPYSAAKAHAELVPHAVVKALPGGHMGPMSQATIYAQELDVFAQRVESGPVVLTHSDRAPALSMIVPESSRFLQNAIIAGLLFLVVFFSEDLACIAGGILAAAGTCSLSAAILGCFLGIFISDLGLYAIGRFLGANALKLKFVARAAEGGAYDRFRRGYEGSGFRIVFVTRFIPGSRVIAYVTAGVLKVKFPRFTLWLAVAASIWTPILVSLSYFVGRPLITWWEHLGWLALPVMFLALIFLYGSVHTIIQSLSYRGRRRLRGRWLRLTRWEYWPTLPVYFPVIIYAFFLALKYRGTTLWAMCNPGMSPLSGLALESKSEILDSLNKNSDSVADWVCIESTEIPEARFDCLERFRQEHALDWPVVLKPDVGQRGEGVAIIRNVEQAKRYLEENTEPVIAQRFIPGAEFGVFYIKMPGAKNGRIFSITEKVLPEIVGDGVRTVERLILDDSRAVAQAKHYRRVNADRLAEIIPEGESIQLVELGTHCRGAIFLDGNRYHSATLSAHLDEVVSTYEGFYFGRFDLRVPSGEAMQRAEGIQILELNGVSSESTDIYDPNNSIIAGWAKLCRQWALAYEIGAANRAEGVKVPKWREIWQVLRRHGARKPYEAF